jgi:hypothetical protein
MKDEPSEPLCRKRLQTAMSCCGQKSVVVNVMVKRRGETASSKDERDECKWTFDEASKGSDDIKTGVAPLPWDEHGRHLLTDHAMSGV